LDRVAARAFFPCAFPRLWTVLDIAAICHYNFELRPSNIEQRRVCIHPIRATESLDSPCVFANDPASLKDQVSSDSQSTP
jgi:hypothetical protein